jgi:hypothetical protein
MDNRLYHFQNGNRTEIVLEQEEYSELDHTCGLWLDEDIVAVGTITQGVVFIDVAQADVQRASDNTSGLLGNEVLSLALDRDNGLWVGESVGLSRIAPDLPITRWDNYTGLVGSLLLAQGIESPYVGTSQGLVRLVEVPKYREVTYFEDVETGILEKKPKKNKSKGLLRFLKKKNEEEIVDNRVTSRVERVRQEVVSTSYEYQQLEEIGSEIDQFIEGSGFQIVGGLGGVYELGDKGVQIILEEPVRSLLLTRDSESLWVNTLDNQLTVFTREGESWIKLETASGFTVTIDYMFESSDGYLWLNGADVIYRIYLLDQRIAEIMDYQIDNPFFDKTLSFERGGEIYFVNASGYFNYDEDLDSIVVNEELMGILDVPGKYIADPEGNVWVEGVDDWYRIYGDTIRKEDVLQLFKDIRSVSYKDDAYWIITNKDELFRFSDSEKEQLVSNHNLFLKEVTSADGKISPLRFKRVGEDRSSLVFEFIQPDYAGFFGIKYRYKLLGLEQEWSEWSENNRIQFPYLPNGSYTMLVQTIDIFGQITDSEPLKFKVVPPYWRRPWFYLLEVSVFVTLLLFSIRLRRQEKFSIVSRVLAFMTLILGVEFVQIVAETYFKTGDTPVIEFFIQVGIAFAILPFESILRRAVLGDRGKPAEATESAEPENNQQ